ncbi:MAG: hypothetical protein HGA55_02375, partial [Methanoregulaceae archaeon]|nr:hypothetical protein [Methanoregulaceae archaeon]
MSALEVLFDFEIVYFKTEYSFAAIFVFEFILSFVEFLFFLLQSLLFL